MKTFFLLSNLPISPTYYIDQLNNKPFNYGMQIQADEVSDGYHTMHELYQHRMALNVALFNLLENMAWNDIEQPIVVKSKLHNDGTMFEGGYFIVACRNPQLSYHYKLEHWDKFRIPEVERVPWVYDGHSASDIIDRLIKS